jgi:ABC-type uncharacterized transport system substrate-binding protein
MTSINRRRSQTLPAKSSGRRLSAGSSTRNSVVALTCLMTASMLATSRPVLAHPHIWVTAETTLLFDKGTATGIRHRWLFDEYYSTMAIQGLDANNDGIYDRKELAELAQVNIDGLKEMGYFTSAKLGELALAFDGPKDFWLEHVEVAEAPGPASQIEDLSQQAAAPEAKPGPWARLKQRFAGKPAEPIKEQEKPAKPKVLALEFTLPFSKPVLAEAEGLAFSIYDPDFMIWFDLAKKDAAKLASTAPKGCQLVIDTPKNAPDLQSLSDAMMKSMNEQPGATASAGVAMAKTVTLKCPKI